MPLAASLRAATVAARPANDVREQPAPPETPPPEAADVGVFRDLGLMRLAALEAFERARDALLEELARSVLARELMLAPADVEGLAARLLERFADAQPVALVVSEADAGTLRVALPVRVDPALAPGDLVIEVRDGVLDARFALRLEAALERAR